MSRSVGKMRLNDELKNEIEQCERAGYQFIKLKTGDFLLKSPANKLIAKLYNFDSDMFAVDVMIDTAVVHYRQNIT